MLEIIKQIKAAEGPVSLLSVCKGSDGLITHYIGIKKRC